MGAMGRPGDAARRHWRRVGVMAALALGLHAALLGGANWAWPQAEPAPLPAARVSVRTVELPAVRPVPETRAFAPPAASLPPARPTPKPGVVKPALARPKPAPPALGALSPERAPAIETAVALPERAEAAPERVATAAEPASPGSDDEPIPRYRTRMPPPITLRYDVGRGLLHGTGELAWRPQGDRYVLKLDFRLSGLTILSQASSGAFDTAGIAPLRFTDRRVRRGTTAANFQREADKITYSGSPNEFALRGGAQDRLSWMLQLAAIVSAEPQLGEPGAKVVMYVTGANGDAGVWSFRCIGPEPVAARGGSVAALKFVREPRELHDTTVQIWLDPAQHHLPVRATQKSGPGDEGYELRLLEAVAPG
jgi:hypothetical protein